MHNMMVEERIGHDGMESDDFYEDVSLQSNVDSLDEDNSKSSESSGDVAIVGNFDNISGRESNLKYKIV